MVTQKQIKELQNLISKDHNSQRVNNILSLVAAHFKTSIPEIQSTTRKTNVIEARNLFCFLALHFTNCTQQQVGYLINRKQSLVNRHYGIVCKAISNEDQNACTHLVQLIKRVK